jgi:D-alanyl-D-alanine carboxypeptidase
MNTNGLHHDSHYTTAADLAVIFEYALGFEEFRTVINTPSHVFQATNMHTFDGWSISRNTNYLLNDPWILGEDSSVVQVVGGKTGTTIVAGTGMTLLAVNKNGDEMITVVCGIPYDSANRQTTFVAAVLNAGAQACFDADPVVRVEGNVMDYLPKNAPGLVAPEIIQPSDPEETTPTEPTESTTTEPVLTEKPAVQEDPEESFSLFSYLKKNPIIAGLAILVILFVLAIILLVIIPAIVRRRRTKKRRTGFQGIRRI